MVDLLSACPMLDGYVTMIVAKVCWTRSTEAKTEKGDGKQIRLCFETEGLHQDCPGIHEKNYYKVTCYST